MTTTPTSQNADRSLAAIILAAGKGTRMQSDLPKVAHPVADHPMVWWVVKAAREAGASPIVVVVGHGADVVRGIFEGDDEDLIYVTQHEQLGTGHATDCARDALADFKGDVLVLAGDGPLIRTSTIRTMHDRQRECDAIGALATSVIDDPTGYGRIVRDDDRRFVAIVEHKNCTDAQREIREVYPSYACFDATSLFDALSTLAPNDLTGEYYVTDVPMMLKDQGHRIEVVDAVPPEDVLSINTLEQLAEVDSILRSRLEGQMAGGHA
ncbi:MAG: NTP transferase domain-containing protein [Planctomycetota bacterium]